MKKSLCIFGSALLVLLISSCNKELKEFDIAVQSNSIQSLKDFLVKYPEGKYVDSANVLIDRLNWQDVMSKNTIADYETFIAGFPESKYLDSAKIMLDKQYPVREIVEALDSGIVNIDMIGTDKESGINLHITNNFKNPIRIKIPSGKTVLAEMQFGKLAVTSATDTILVVDSAAIAEIVLVQSGEAKITKGTAKLSKGQITLEANTTLFISVGL
jgi:hypothetical protein